MTSDLDEDSVVFWSSYERSLLAKHQAVVLNRTPVVQNFNLFQRQQCHFSEIRDFTLTRIGFRRRRRFQISLVVRLARISPSVDRDLRLSFDTKYLCQKNTLVKIKKYLCHKKKYLCQKKEKRLVKRNAFLKKPVLLFVILTVQYLCNNGNSTLSNSSPLSTLQGLDAILVNWWVHSLFTRLTLLVHIEDVFVSKSSTKHRALGTSSRSCTRVVVVVVY